VILHVWKASIHSIWISDVKVMHLHVLQAIHYILEEIMYWTCLRTKFSKEVPQGLVYFLEQSHCWN